MGILQLPTALSAQVGVEPSTKKMVTTDSLATITTAGYLNGVNLQSNPIDTEDVLEVLYSFNQQTRIGTFGIFTVSISNGVISLVQWANPGDVLLPVVAGDFANFNGTTGQIKDSGLSPSDPAKTKVVMANGVTVANHIMVSTDTAGTSGNLTGTAINNGNIQAGLSGTAGTLGSFPSAVTSGELIVAAVTNSSGDFNTTISNASAVGQSQVISIPDSGAATANFLLSGGLSSQTVAYSSSSATPGSVRALIGKSTLSNATYANTTNSVAGVRGEIDMVGGSSGFIYGVQGKVIPTGTLSGSIWAPAVFGQYDLSGATINAGQIAAIWGDMGATGGTFTDVTGARMFAGTNTIASLTLNSMIYLYGKATSLFELSGSSSTYISAGAATPSGDLKKIAITIDGVVHYILAAAVWS